MRRLTLPALLLLAACGGGETGPTPPPPPPPPPPGPAPVASIALDQSDVGLVPQFTVQLTATPKDANGTTLTGRTITWQSNATSVASVSGGGLVTGLAVGTTLITAASEGRSAVATVTVREGASIGPAGGTVIANGGKAKITIPAGAVAATLPISVTPITAPPTPAGLVAGTAYELGPTGTTFAQPVTLEFKYDSQGIDSLQVGHRLSRLTGDKWIPLPGGTGGRTDFTVRAQTSSFSAYAIMNVFSVGQLTISPAFPSVFFNETVQLTAPPVDPALVPAGSTVTRSWTGVAQATVSASGLLTGVVPGGPYQVRVQDQWQITCPWEPLGCFMGYFDFGTPQQQAVFAPGLTYLSTGLADVVVGLKAVAAVAVGPANLTLAPNQQQALSVTLTDATGAALSAQYRTINWSSSNPLVASVSQAGQVTALAPGTSTISAEVAGVSGSAQLTVTGSSSPVVSVEVTPELPTIEVGTTIPLTVTARDGQGQVVPGQSAVWVSLNPAVATVSQSGVVTGVSPGQVPIGATINGIQHGVFVTVVAPYPLVLGTPEVGGYFSCLLRQDTSIWCWGRGDEGQRGDGSFASAQPTPTPVSGGGGYSQVAAGLLHACALKATGPAVCWGYNANGQLGNGTTVRSNTPVSVSGAIVFSRIYASYLHSCGLDAGGTAWCWGDGGSGRLGQGTIQSSATPVSVLQAPPFTQLALTHNNSCGLTSAGQVWCWGPGQLGSAGLGGPLNEGSMVPRPVVGGHSFTQLVAGGPHFCGLKANGEVWCWGLLNYAIVDEGLGISTSTPVKVNTPVLFTTISAGGYNTCGLAQDQTAWCWGTRWGLGTGYNPAQTYVVAPVPVFGSRQFSQISTGDANSCARAADGTWCWGDWSYNQLGGDSHGYITYKVRFP